MRICQKIEKKHMPFLLCAGLFLLALIVSLAFSQEETEDFQGLSSGHIVLSEILSSNRTYPNENGAYADYIEVRNLSDQATDISGYKLGDSLDSIGYTFPQGTVLPAGGYIAVWCSKDDDTGTCAAFGISRDGETIYLYNSANVLVDSVSVPRMNDNIPLVRKDDGTWEAGTQATPGFENTSAGYESWLLSMGGQSSMQVVISEVMTGNTCTSLDSSGTVADWIELWNAGNSPVVLDGTYLSDNPADPLKWQIPALTLQPGQRSVIRCVGTGAAEGEATFALPRSGCTLVLTGRMGNTVSSVTVPEISRDSSWALLADGSYDQADYATPGFENTTAGYESWLETIPSGDIRVVISEVMTGNCSTILNAAGKLCDWVELTNVGAKAAVLDGAYLSDDPDDRSQWQIPALTLQPGQSVVIPCSGSSAAEDEATFALKKSGCTLTLTGPGGNILDAIIVPAMDDDRSWALLSDGSFAQTVFPTPGYPNTREGREDYLRAQAPAGPLVITEVMPSNARYLQQADGEYYDWVELQNQSDASIELSDYFLSNDAESPALMALPRKTLAPGERIVIICSGNTELTGKYIHAPFTLSREESWVYVTSRTDGTFSDYIRVYDVPYQGSVGRVTGENGTYYFTEPTPGTANGAGVAFISETPVILTADGVFDNVQSVVVEISGAGEVRYTLDGSLPTASSPRYTGPITLTATTVVRAASFEDDMLRSDVVTGAYIINEYHTLPVISLAADPSSLFGSGIYDRYYTEREVPCNVKLFEDGQGFSIDCGLEMFGKASLSLPKKSFKITFRDRYGEDLLHYPVYGEEGPEYYDALAIRAGQDYTSTIFRDELLTSLCRDLGDDVLVQQDKFCILYINGEYWGIYCLKEAFCETMYATHYDVTEDSVERLQAPVSLADGIGQIYGYCRTHDPAVPEHYDYICSQVNIDSLTDWMIMQGYSANTDTRNNIRYFRSSQDGGKWVYAFYDLDWGFYAGLPFVSVFFTDLSWQHISLTRGIMNNEEFRRQFLTRLSQLMDTTLSNENVLERIDYYVDLLDEEVPRERAKWGGSYATWMNEVEQMRDYIENGHLQRIVTALRRYAGLTAEEAQTYFAQWIS